MLDIKQEVLAAESRIRPIIRETPLDYSIPLSRITGANVYLKCENLQYTGSFKARGAMSKLLSLTPAEQALGVVTASSGNHGTAVAFGLNKLKLHGIVFVPENASSAKVANIQNYNIPLEFFGAECMQAQVHALAYAKEHKMNYISPYNDLQVIGGQGTVGLEIAHQLDKIDAVFVPVGGGGLISGIGCYLKEVSPSTKIIGCLPQNSPVMADSVKAGHIVNMPIQTTLSDGTAGKLWADCITFDICKKVVDDFILVSEEEIKLAIIHLIQMQHQLLEGAAGVALASLIKNAQQYKNKNVVIVLSGENISLETLKTVLS